jgi:hypothetical protein
MIAFLAGVPPGAVGLWIGVEGMHLLFTPGYPNFMVSKATVDGFQVRI